MALPLCQKLIGYAELPLQINLVPFRRAYAAYHNPYKGDQSRNHNAMNTRKLKKTL
jgi:hypothetical protein